MCPKLTLVIPPRVPMGCAQSRTKTTVKLTTIHEETQYQPYQDPRFPSAAATPPSNYQQHPNGYREMNLQDLENIAAFQSPPPPQRLEAAYLPQHTPRDRQVWLEARERYRLQQLADSNAQMQYTTMQLQEAQRRSQIPIVPPSAQRNTYFPSLQQQQFTQGIPQFFTMAQSPQTNSHYATMAQSPRDTTFPAIYQPTQRSPHFPTLEQTSRRLSQVQTYSQAQQRQSQIPPMLPLSLQPGVPPQPYEAAYPPLPTAGYAHQHQPDAAQRARDIEEQYRPRLMCEVCDDPQRLMRFSHRMDRCPLCAKILISDASKERRRLKMIEVNAKLRAKADEEKRVWEMMSRNNGRFEGGPSRAGVSGMVGGVRRGGVENEEEDGRPDVIQGGFGRAGTWYREEKGQRRVMRWSEGCRGKGCQGFLGQGPCILLVEGKGGEMDVESVEERFGGLRDGGETWIRARR